MGPALRSSVASKLPQWDLYVAECGRPAKWGSFQTSDDLFGIVGTRRSLSSDADDVSAHLGVAQRPQDVAKPFDIRLADDLRAPIVFRKQVLAQLRSAF